MIADGKELIALISEIRSQYNCFDNADQKYYEALSLVLRILGLPSEQPCDDAVSRAAAIDAINSHFGFNIEEEYGSAVQEIINGLPSAQPDLTYIIHLYGEEATIKLIGTLKRLGRNDLLPPCVR